MSSTGSKSTPTKKEGSRGFVLPYTPNYVFVEDEEHAKQVLSILLEQKIVAVDTETTGLDPYLCKLLLFQIATPDCCYILNCGKVNAEVWKPIVESRKILKIVQNASFDYKILKVHAKASMRPVFDTMIAERLLTVGKSRKTSLQYMASKYLGMDLSKEIRRDFIGVYRDKFSRAELLYAANDALILFEIYDRQIDALQRDELITVALLEFNTVIPVAEMELNGCLIDQYKWRSLLKIARIHRDEVEKKIKEALLPVCSQLSIFGECTVNISSQKQLLTHLNRLGIKIEDTSDETLKKINHPVTDLIRKWRGWEKICTAYGEKFLSKINPKTGRLHAQFNQVRADTGRMSSSKPNLQQVLGYIPDNPESLNFRSCFIAPPGYKMVTADFCLDPRTRVLTEDLKWKSLVDSREGDVLVGIDEFCGEGSNCRKLRKTVIEKKKTLVTNSYKITFDDGTELISSALHRWLVYSVDNGYYWKETKLLLKRDLIGFVVDPYCTDVLNSLDSFWSSWENKIPDLSKYKTISSIECIGDHEVIGIQTSTRTFIAEGFVSHNSQQELRIIACLSRDPSFIAAYVNEEDIHTQTAIGIWGGTEEEVRTNGKRKIAKCVSGDTKINVDNMGLIPIKNISSNRNIDTFSNVHDYRVASNIDGIRLYTEVDQFYYNGIGDAYEIETSLGYNITVGDRHKFRVVNKDGTFGWKKAKDLNINDTVCMSSFPSTVSGLLPLTIPEVEKNTSYIDIELPTHYNKYVCRWLGYFVAEGSVYGYTGKNNTYTVSITVKDSDENVDMVNDLRSVHKHLFKDRYKESYYYRNNNKYIIFKIHSKKVVSWLSSLNTGNTSSNKRIPQVIFKLSMLLIAEFLKALYEGDGWHCGEFNIGYCSKSEKLIDDLQQCLLLYDVWSSKKKRTLKSNTSFYYLTIVGNDSRTKFVKKIGFISSRKNNVAINASFNIDKELIPFPVYKLKKLLPTLSGVSKEKIRECIRENKRVALNRSRAILLINGSNDKTCSEYKELAKLLFSGFRYLRVTKKVKTRTELFDLSVPSSRCYVTNGYLTHNTVNFLMSYGGSAYTLANRLGMTEEEAIKIIDNYFRTYSGLKDYIAKAGSFALENGYSLTISGRRRYYNLPSIDDEKYKQKMSAIRRKGANTPVQGCLRKEALIYTNSGYVSIKTLLHNKNYINYKVWTGTKWAPFVILNMGTCRSADIILHDNTKIPCDIRHKILKVSDSGYEWVDFEDIKHGDSVAKSLVVDENKFQKEQIFNGHKLAPSFLIEDFFKELKNIPLGKFSKQDLSIIDNIKNSSLIDLRTLYNIVTKLNIKLNYPIYSYSGIKEIIVYNGEEETYTLSVDDDEHVFDCQGVITKNSAADVSKQALCNFFYSLEEKGYDAQLLMIVHDELVCQVREDQAAEVAKLLEEAMIKGFTDFFDLVPMKVDACIDTYWHH